MRELHIEHDSFVMIWDSLDEMARDADEFTRKIGENKACKDGLQKPYWSGREFPNGWKSAVNYCLSPWKEGVEYIENCIQQFEGINLGTPRSVKRRRNFSMFDGDEIIIERLYGGTPEFWETRYPKPSRGNPIVQVILPLGGLGGYSSEELMWKCAVATAIAYIVEDQGWRAEIWGMNVANGTYTTASDARDSAIAVSIKKSNEPMNIDVMASIGSGWFYRTMGFQSKSAPIANKEFKARIRTGMGSTCHWIPDWFLNKVGGDYPTILIPHVYGLKKSISAGRTALQDFIKQTEGRSICSR